MRPKLLNVEPIRDQDVVETLERALRKAISGEMTDVAIAGVMRGGGCYRATAGTTLIALIGATDLLKNLLLQDAEQ